MRTRNQLPILRIGIFITSFAAMLMVFQNCGQSFEPLAGRNIASMSSSKETPLQPGQLPSASGVPSSEKDGLIVAIASTYEKSSVLLSALKDESGTYPQCSSLETSKDLLTNFIPSTQQPLPSSANLAAMSTEQLSRLFTNVNIVYVQIVKQLLSTGACTALARDHLQYELTPDRVETELAFYMEQNGAIVQTLKNPDNIADYKLCSDTSEARDVLGSYSKIATCTANGCIESRDLTAQKAFYDFARKLLNQNKVCSMVLQRFI